MCLLLQLSLAVADCKVCFEPAAAVCGLIRTCCRSLQEPLEPPVAQNICAAQMLNNRIWIPARLSCF